MRTSLALFVACLTLATLGGCKKEAQSPAAQPSGWQQSPAGYGDSSQTGYAQPAATSAATTVAPAPTATSPTTTATAATGMNPNPQGLACSSDAMCATHKCNTSAGKCSWPCMSAADCATGMQCAVPFCVPAGLPFLPAATK